MSKFCTALNNNLCFFTAGISFCCTLGRAPGVSYTGGEVPLGKILRLRNSLIKGLNEDMSHPIEHNEDLSTPMDHHPCLGCPYLEESPCVPEPSEKLDVKVMALCTYTYCNSKCDYCVSYNSTKGDAYSAKAVIEQLEKSGSINSKSCRVDFSGGEIAINKEYLDILKEFSQDKRFSFQIASNGIIKSPIIEEALKTCENITVSLSLDSGDRDSFLAVKKVDKFDEVVNTIAAYAAAAAGTPKFQVKYIIYDKNNSIDILDKFIKICEDCKVKHVNVTPNFNECSAENGVSEKTLKGFAYLCHNLEKRNFSVGRLWFTYLNEKQRTMIDKEITELYFKDKQIDPESSAEYAEKLLPYFGESREAALLKAYMTEFIKGVSVRSSGFALFCAGAHTKWLISIMKDSDLHPAVIFDDNYKTIAKEEFPYPVDSIVNINKYQVDTIVISSDTFHYEILAKLTKNPALKEIKILDPYFNLPKAPYAKK